MDRLQVIWDRQMTTDERSPLSNLAQKSAPLFRIDSQLAEKAVTWAEEHLFERRSVVQEHELWRHALEHGRGESITLKEIHSITSQRGYLRYAEHPGKVTTREHLQREWEIICLAKEGRDQFGPFAFEYQSSNRQLDVEQRQAVEGILHSPGFVALFRGGAGTGKSFTLREIQSALQEQGYAVRMIAPQRQQVMDLEREGFQNVETVSAFLTRGKMPDGAVVLVDEAGQIGGKQMHALLRLVQENHGRVILSGDTRQHGAVEATDALRAIEKHSGLYPIELTQIRRQNPLWQNPPSNVSASRNTGRRLRKRVMER